MNTRNVFYEVTSEEMMNVDGGTVLTNGCVGVKEFILPRLVVVVAASSGVKTGINMIAS